MNINTLRKQYGNMSVYQRLALADHALGRGDHGEVAAIKKESPSFSYTAVDFFHGMTTLTNIRLVNIIDRLGEIIRFNALMQIHFQQSSEGLLSPTRADNLLRMTAYRYTVATDSLRRLHEEMGLRDTFEKEMEEFLPIDALKTLEPIIRDLAFTEEEAREWAEKNCNAVPLTVDKYLEKYREELAEAID